MYVKYISLIYIFSILTFSNLTAQENNLHFTLSEKNYLAKQESISFVGDPNWLPFEAFNDSSEYIGIVADYLHSIETLAGVDFNPIQTQDWSQTIAHARKGDIDVISDDISSSALQEHYNPIPSYIKSPLVIVMRGTQNFVNDLEDITDKKIALIVDYGFNDEIISKYPNQKFTYEKNANEALESLSKKKIDAVILSMPKALYLISSQGYTSVKVVGKIRVNLNLTLFVHKDKPELFSIINKSMHILVNTKNLEILRKWQKVEFAHKTDYILIFAITVVFVVFLLFFIYWNRKLSDEVKLRKEIEISLRHSEEQMNMLISNIPLNVAVTSYEGKVLLANPQTLKDYDVDADSLDKINMIDYYADSKQRNEVMKELKEEGRIHQKVVKFLSKQGTRSMMLSILPINYFDKPSLLTIGLDMTQRLLLEDELLQAKREAESANRSKSEFLANMSHEIRTPMNAIIGFTELLAEQVTEPRLQSYTKTIQNASKNLLLLINDILDLSKIEAGKLEIEKSPTNIFDLIEEVSSVFSINVKNKNLDFMIEVDENIPQSLFLDELRLRQVIFNLIGNSIKFTQTGFIKLSVYASTAANSYSKLNLKIIIEDTGIGIAKDQLEQIFHEFKQQEGQDSRKFGGTGLGLSISQRLSNMMGGDISVRSVLSEGSTFCLELFDVDISSVMDERKIQREDERANSQIVFTPAKVLIVDDVADNLELLIRNFENTNIEVSTAINGLEAIAKYKEVHPDLILMDIRMPVMDGYEAAIEIKKISSVPIIALTASVMKDDFERAKKENFDGYLRKPILKYDLYKELSSFLKHDYIDNQTKEQNKEVVFSEKTKLHLADIYTVLESDVLPFVESFKASKNIGEIHIMAKKLVDIASIYDIQVLDDYSFSLHQALDSFDIISLENLLNDFEMIKEKFSD